MKDMPRQVDVSVRREDLETVSEAVMLRFPLRHAETQRCERMGELLAASSELARALTQHTQHALVHCRGSHGTGDLLADADALYSAFAAYGALIRDVAAQYRSAVHDPITPPVEAPAMLAAMRLDAAAL